MKRLILFAVFSIFFFYISAFPAFGQTEQQTTLNPEEADTAKIPDLKTDANLKQINWDLDRLFDDALEQLPSLLTDIPAKIKRIAVVRIDGDEHVYVNTVALKYKLQNALINSGQFQVVECRQCNNMKVYVEDESLILSRSVESNEQIARLGKELNIDAYIQGVVTINEAVGKMSLALQLIDVTNGTILRSTSLESFFLDSDKQDQKVADQSQTKDSYKIESDLDLELLFPKLLENLPLELGNLPPEIGSVALADFQGDDVYAVDEKRLQILLENTLVNRTKMKIIECPVCAVQQEYAKRDAAVFPESAASGRRMKKLSEQLGFDAYVKSNLKIHEDERKIELDVKVIKASDNSVVKAITLKTADEDRQVDQDSEHSLTYTPAVGMSLEGDAGYKDGQVTTGKIESFQGLQYRFVTTTIIEDLLIGLDIEAFMGTESDTSESMHASVTLFNFIVKYRLPFKFGIHRMFNAAFGYGTGFIDASVEDYHENVSVKSMKIEGDALITRSFAIGIVIYLMGNYDLKYKNDTNSTIVPEQSFNGNGGSIFFRYTF